MRHKDIQREQLLNYPNVGAAFEAYIFEEIIKGIQATETVNWTYYYFRTRNGAELDMILEGSVWNSAYRNKVYEGK